MATNIFTSALSGLNAAQYAITTTEHNIANANTLGFTRQEVQVSARAGDLSGAGFIGQGVNVAGVKRIYDQFLTTQVRQEQAQASYLSSYHTAMKQIDNLIADPTAGASPAMQDFFSAMNGVSSNPESTPARQTMLSNAQFVVNRFQAIDQRMTDIATSLTGQISSSVKTINTYAQQIATLNGNIKLGIAAGQGQQPNDLMDQRDQLVNLLNQEIKVTTQIQADGSMNVYIGTGQSLVVNEQASTMQVIQSASDPSKVDVAYLNNGKTIPMQQTSLQGGNLGAYLTFRDQSLEPARNALGRVALGLAASVNQQNQLGLDLNGAMGGAIFNAATPRVDKAPANTGTSTVSAAIASVSALTTSDYQLKFDGANYSVTRLTDNVTTALGPKLPQTVDGFTMSVVGTTLAGDSFLIRPTANGARDMNVLTTNPASIAAALPMRATTSISNIGSGVISSGTINTNPVKIAFSDPVIVPQTYSVTDTATNTLLGTGNFTPGAAISFNGWSVNIAGVPGLNDTFSLAKNPTANAMTLTTPTTNVGTGAISGGILNLQQPFSVKFNALNPNSASIAFSSPTNYTITDNVTLATQVGTYTAGTPITFNGWSVNVAGVPVAGDTFGLTKSANANAMTLTSTVGVGSTATITGGNPTYTVTGALPNVSATPIAYVSGAPINLSYNGWNAQITGTPSANDTFTMTANTGATGDNRNALMMASLQSQNLMANGTTTFQGAYGQLVGDIGSKTHELDLTSQAQTSMVAQSVAAQQSVSGVNLDEEAANLMRYQKAYQAAAKAMQIASTMFDALLALGK